MYVCSHTVYAISISITIITLSYFCCCEGNYCVHQYGEEIFSIICTFGNFSTLNLLWIILLNLSFWVKMKKTKKWIYSWVVCAQSRWDLNWFIRSNILHTDCLSMEFEEVAEQNDADGLRSVLIFRFKKHHPSGAIYFVKTFSVSPRMSNGF